MVLVARKGIAGGSSEHPEKETPVAAARAAGALIVDTMLMQTLARCVLRSAGVQMHIYPTSWQRGGAVGASSEELGPAEPQRGVCSSKTTRLCAHLSSRASPAPRLWKPAAAFGSEGSLVLTRIGHGMRRDAGGGRGEQKKAHTQTHTRWQQLWATPMSRERVRFAPCLAASPAARC